jgi:hypothetical protein
MAGMALREQRARASLFGGRQVRYILPMSRIDAAIAPVRPSATPTSEEIAAWESLPRDEQVRLLQEMLAHPDCARDSGSTMEDILGEAREIANSRRG